ncbi:mucin-19 [Anopheles marshallii]|uniref:mucin-19 n=1 Tax=Anopheles marshallii TaxID=1521116 RepID=UPI00237BB985|nr:mucin-19 [Anopheles marshallii]
MNSGESDLVEFDGRRIQRDTVPNRQKQQVSTIVGEESLQAAYTEKDQPVHFHSNHQGTNHNGEWKTLVGSYDETTLEYDANTIVMDGSFQQHQHTNISKNRITVDQKPSDWLRVGLNVTAEKYVENSNAIALTDGNGVLEQDEPLLHTTQGCTSIEKQVRDHGRTGSVMRDPQESQHRSAPTAPLGEVESGEDDNDCVVVPATERKVEPLKINLARDREPLRTVIKRTPGASSTPDSFQQLSPTIRDVPGSPKITIKPPKPPPTVENTLVGLAGGSSTSSTSSSSLTGAEQHHHTNNCAGSGSALPSYSSIPKLTIKPIINPADDTLACETASTVGTAASVEQMHIIPKLLIKGSVSSLDASHGRDGAMERHIVPKLTIRGVNNHNHHHHQQQQQQHHFAQNQLDSQVYSNDGIASAMLQMDGSVGGRGESSGTGSPTPLVPKLTIKMDNHHHHHLHQHHTSLRVKDGPDVIDGGGSMVGGPIPKLHIKTVQQDGVGPSTGINNNSSSSSGNCSTSSPGLPPVLTSSEGVKLTIKPLPEPKLPKLTIKTTGLGTIAESSDVSMVSSTSNSFSPKLLPSSVTCSSSGEQLQQHVVCGIASVSQLLQQHQQQQPASPSDQHSNISSSSIPKLTIKPMPPKDATCVQDCSADGNSSSNMRGECSVTPTVPKLTIKPILPPAKQSVEDSSSSSEISINSLESSPISSSSISSAPASVVVTTSPPTALRMTIKVPSSAPQQQHESNLVGDGASSALMGTATGSSSTTAAATVVTRLNIKPVLPPPSNADRNEPSGLDGVREHGKDHSMVMSDDSGSTLTSCEESHKPIVIPKVTIKTLANPRSQETEILSTPKVTLKPIPKPQDENLVTGNLLERHLLLGGTGLSPIMANNAGPTVTNSMLGSATSTGSGQDSMDSPRIILKINKGSSSTTTTSGEQLEGTGPDGGPIISVPQPPGSSILANELKRPATNAMCASTIPSSGSSSVSCASSTSVSASATSSSAGSDPASPSSGGGGDQGELGTLEIKRSKLDHSQSQLTHSEMQGVLSHHQDLLQQNQHQYQLQLKARTNAELTRRPLSSGAASSKNVSDIIVIDDDSKSENETPREKDVMASSVMRLPPTSVDPLAINDRMVDRSFAALDGGALAQAKPRRTRGTPRGGGGRQSRRGNGRGAGSSAMAKQQQLHTNAAVSQLLGILVQDEREEGSSSDCMIVDEPATPATNMRESLTLENLLRGTSKPSVPSSASISGSNFYSVPMTGGGTGSEVEKNGTASNSSIGSVTSSVSSSVVGPASTPAATGRTPVAGVRMSTRRAAGQLLKEVLANKHQDRDSGVDEARTDGEFGATPSKRPRGRPKKQSVDMVTETNGGGNSNSVDGSIGGLEAASGSNMLLAMAMMGSEDGSTLLRTDNRGFLGAQSLMEGIVPLPRTPTRTPRSRGRGRGRGRGKVNLIEAGSVFGGATLTESGASPADRNVDPLFIGTPNNIDPTTTDTSQGFHLLFNHLQTPPRGGAGARTRGGRRGPGSRGPRTPRGGRGAAKNAMAALLTVGGTPSSDIIGSFADLTAAQEAATKQLLDALQQQQQELLLQQLPLSPSAPDMTPKPRGRGRGSRGIGTLTGSRRKGTRGSTKAAGRGRKGLNVDSQMLTSAESSPGAGVSGDIKNAIFMTPMAGGLDLNRPKLHVRALKTPKNEIKSNTPPSSAEAIPSTSGATPSRTPTVDSGSGGLQVFEEDTRMSGDFNFTTPVRMLSTGDGCLQQNEESQSSYLSSTSVTQDAINQASTHATVPEDKTTTGLGAANVSEAQKDSISGATSASNSNSSSRRINKGKMEVLDSHRAQFTVDLLAEYEWPPPSPGTRGADTFMIQEQIAEYLGVKSFKRKYPDLMRRPVDMEERNFILEQGLASEKMCDLGLTAVYASEILDIMSSDYPEKYEEYTRYTREKHFRELSNRQRLQQEAVSAVVAAAPIDRAQLQKEKAIESAASWNCSFNKERRDSRRACMDLQTYVVQQPKRQQLSRPEGHQQTASKVSTTNYPVALVPGQFSEYYTTYTPEELACYPINTILLDPFELQEIVSSERYRRLVAAEEARLLEDDSSNSTSDSDSDDSSTDNSGTSSDSSSGSDDEAVGRSARTSGSSNSGSSCSDSECGGNMRVKKQRNRLLRGRRPSVIDGNAKNAETTVSASIAVGVTPVRRSSRTMSAGVPVVPTTVECKEPTDSDDSDVPLIAHAVKKKNNLALAITQTATTVPPSAGGGKRMQDIVTPVKRPPINPFMCAVCIGPENKNKYNKPELFVRCSRCRRKAHPSCIGMSSVMYKRVQQYKWQCSECKLCMKCNRRPSAMDSKMVYCDQCDRGYHLACKGLRNLPEGRWHCSICTICGLCGAQTPEGHPNPHLSAQQRQQLAMVAEWTHEYGMNELTNIREHLRTLCVPCVRQRKLSQQPPGATVSGGGGESTAILNNNNNPEPRKLLAATQGVSGIGTLSVPGGVISMKPQSS